MNGQFHSPDKTRQQFATQPAGPILKSIPLVFLPRDTWSCYTIAFAVVLVQNKLLLRDHLFYRALTSVGEALRMAATSRLLPRRTWLRHLLILISTLSGIPGISLGEDDKPKSALEADLLSAESQKRLRDQLLQLDAQLTKQLDRTPDSVDLYSSRGDARFFRADFPAAVSDYERMLKLQPDLDAKHWRLGLAWFYAGKYADAARQFEKYYETDDIDRENGLWRFLSQVRESGIEQARQKMLKYTKPDRGGLGEVYRMYAGELSVEKVLADIRARNVSDEERNQKLFYGELYVGLYESVQNHREQALAHLKAAVENTWPRRAGYGPNYMWHVARLHYELTLKQKPEAAAKKTAPK